MLDKVDSLLSSALQLEAPVVSFLDAYSVARQAHLQRLEAELESVGEQAVISLAKDILARMSGSAGSISEVPIAPGYAWTISLGSYECGSNLPIALAVGLVAKVLGKKTCVRVCPELTSKGHSHGISYQVTFRFMSMRRL